MNVLVGRRARSPDRQPFRQVLRIISLALLSLGIVLLWVEGFTQNYLQSDFSYSADIVASDNYFDPEHGRYLGDRYSNGRFYYQQLGKHGDAVTIKNVIDLTPQVITGRHEVSAKTGEYLPAAPNQSKKQYIFAPRNLQKGQDFTYRHAAYDAPAAMKYVGEETIYGLKTFRYQTRYEAAGIIEDKRLSPAGTSTKTGLAYSPHLQLWVEPSSGWLVTFKDDTTVNYFDRASGRLLGAYSRFSIRYTDDSIRQQATYAKDLLYQRTFTTRTAPAIGLAVILSVLFLILLRRFLRHNPVLRITTSVAVVLSSVALAGWVFNVELITFFSGTASINPLTVACFMLVILSILMIHRQSSRGMVLLLGGIVLATAVIGMLSQLGVITFKPDFLLFGGSQLNDLVPSRFSFYDAHAMFIFALAVICTEYGRQAAALRTAKLLAGTVIVLGIAGLVAKPFRIDQDFSIIMLQSLSAASAALFILCGLLLLTVIHRKEDRDLSWPIVLQSLRRPALLVLPLVLLCAVAQVQQNSVRQQLTTNFAERAAAIQAGLTNTMGRYQTMLAGTQALFAASKEVEPQEWTTYVNAYHLAQDYPGIEGVGFVRTMPRTELADYDIFPVSDRAVVAPVIYLEPQTVANQKSIGYDFLSDDLRSEAMQRAADSGQPSLTPAAGIGTTMVLFMPVYQNGKPTTSVDERRLALFGYVFMKLNVPELVSDSNPHSGAVDFALYDGPQAQSSTLLYSSLGSARSVEPYAPRLTKTATVYIANRPWTITYAARPEFRLSEARERSPTLLLSAGAAFYALAITLMYYVPPVRRTLHRLAARTARIGRYGPRR